MTTPPDKKRARPLAKDEQCNNSDQRAFCKIDATELHMRIANRAEDYLRELFGDSFKTAGNDKWRVGKRGSLAVSIQDGVLVHYSHEDGTGGDAVALWQRERGGTAGEALHAAAAWAGVSDNGATHAPAPAARLPKIEKPAPAPMTREQFAEAHAMSRRLAGDDDLCERIAKVRNWQPQTLRDMALDGALGWHEDKDGGKLAFIYETGIKVRWKKGGERIIRFHTGNAAQLWRGWMILKTTRKVYVTEGETDAITLIDAGAEMESDCLVVALPSSSTLPPDMVATLAGRDIVLCLDQDTAGLEATKKMEALLSGKVRTLKRWRMTR